MNSHKLQKLQAIVIFDSRKGGAPVTVPTPVGFNEPVTGFIWCNYCAEFHILTDEAPYCFKTDEIENDQ